MDHVLRFMKKNGIDLTEENYLDLAYMGADYDPNDAEVRASIPEELREPELEVLE